MVDTREKLIELIGLTEYGKGTLVGNNFQRGFIEKIADNLIANGVTVQEWISVEDRLPKNSTYVNAVTDGVVAQAYWHNGKFFAFTAIGVATVVGVTHWMPLPEPPAED